MRRFRIASKVAPMTQTNAVARLKAGDPAPDATITFAGEATTLHALFQQRRTVLVFLRHFG
jgi:hypothetical protein